MHVMREHPSCSFISGLFEYVKPSWQGRLSFVAPEIDLKKFGASYTADRPSISPATPEVVFLGGSLRVKSVNV